MIEHLPRVVEAAPGRPDLAGPDHPMRRVTQQAAFEPHTWTPERAAKVAALFDDLAPDWNSRAAVHRLEPLHDALDRGGAATRGTCLEIGSGTGLGTQVLERHYASVVALDLSIEMLRRSRGRRVRGDASRLPIRDGAVGTVVLVNALLFPVEVDRVLAEGGSVVWVNTNGDRTPIHLPAADVERALPGEWDGRASEAGWGTWTVLRRRSGLRGRA